MNKHGYNMHIFTKQMHKNTNKNKNKELSLWRREHGEEGH